MSCKHKRELFLLTRNSNNPILKLYYKVYCKILMNVINEAEKVNYNRRILESSTKPKTTWNIINELLGKQHSSNDIQKLTIEGSHLTSQHDIANSFNKYFSSIIDKLNCNTSDKSSLKNSSTYCNKNQNPPMVFTFFQHMK